MSPIAFALLWVPLAFAFVVAASYLGTTYALRSYFDDEPPPWRSGSVRDGDDGGRV